MQGIKDASRRVVRRVYRLKEYALQNHTALMSSLVERGVRVPSISLPRKLMVEYAGLMLARGAFYSVPDDSAAAAAGSSALVVFRVLEDRPSLLASSFKHGGRILMPRLVQRLAVWHTDPGRASVYELGEPEIGSALSIASCEKLRHHSLSWKTEPSDRQGCLDLVGSTPVR